jgi:predicted metal-dependent hydrolase
MEDSRRKRFDRAVELFNSAEYFECHEVFEEIWTPSVNPERRFLQSLIHFAVGLYHHRCENQVGALRQLHKGLRKIGGYLPARDGLDTAHIEREFRRCIATIEAGGAVAELPRMKRLDAPPA